MNVFEFYNYMYFRVAKWYFQFEEKDRKFSTGAAGLVTLSQIFILIDLIGIYLLESYDQELRIVLMKQFYPYFIGIVIFIYLLNGWKYRNKYDKYSEKWKDESKKEKNIRGIIVFLLIILPLIFIPIVLNIKDYTI